MIKELIIDLQQIENVLLYRIIQQDESFKGKGKLFEKDDISIHSANHKAIITFEKTTSLYTNGLDEETDCLVWSKDLMSVERATEIKAKIEKCVVAFNEHIRKENEQENEKEMCGFSYDETYWYLNNGGIVGKGDWVDDRFDKFRYNSKNAFKTPEEAKRKQEILNYIYENQTLFTKEQWEDGEDDRYSIYADIEGRALHTGYRDHYKEAKYFFKGKETAQKVADFIGYADYMKYL